MAYSLSSSMPLALSSAATTTTAAFFPTFYRNKKDPSSSTIYRANKFVTVCRSRSNNGKGEETNNSLWPDKFIDRRGALIGLGSLYGSASSTFGADPFAIAAPVTTPDPSTCQISKDMPDGIHPVNCCPPSTDNVKPFLKLRVRKAAHLLDKEYIEKYKEAVALMKALPDDDPRSFKQQADIHCAYCNGGYEQLGFPIELQVHFSWLFFPFHRYYLYFHEKILGSLIKDPDFALPFWNYDAPDGMEMPEVYTEDVYSSLYDPLRDERHRRPTLVDLDYNKVEPTISRDEQIKRNLKIMYRQVVSGASLPLLFFGQPYRAGGQPNPGSGTVENIPHNAMHLWTGDPKQPQGMNMGTFFSAARDPIFYAHHSNIDRFWTIWKTLGEKRRDIQHEDYLNASFVFYDENCEAVRVYVKDCLDTRPLGYVYEDVPIPWLKTPPTPQVRRIPKRTKKKAARTIGKLPSVVDKIVSFEVKRSKKSRSKKEKKDEEEILVIDGIECDGNKAIKFDVLINDEDNREIRADNTEFAGTFVNVPHMKDKSMKLKTCLKLGISELLEDLNADDDDDIIVTLIPRFGGGFSVQDIKIEYEG